MKPLMVLLRRDGRVWGVVVRPGHLYLQRYGHPGGPTSSWGMSLRGAGRGKLLVRAVARDGGVVELGMTDWALTVAAALGMTPREFHEPSRVGPSATSSRPSAGF